MLIRITWLLVLVGLGLVIGGFLTTDSNVLLILAIAVEIAAIILVLASWARRAREASALGYEEEVSFADEDTGEAKEEELYAALEADEEFAIGGRRSAASTRRPARKKSGAPAGRSTAKAKPAASARKTTAKSTSKAKGAAKPKPTRKAKPKAQGTTTRPKAKQPRPRPPSASP